MNRDNRHRERDVAVYTDDYDRSAKRHKSDRQLEASDQHYRTLCISHLNSRFNDTEISEMIYRDLRKFGDFNVKVIHNGNHRVAYVNFRYPEDAKSAKHACYNHVVLLDVGKRIDAVYNTKPQLNFGPGMPRDDYYRSGSPHSLYSDRPKDEYIGRRDSGYYGHDLLAPVIKGQAKNEKFGHYNLAEDDEIATRTLFVGNLAYDITVDELKQVFELYGFVEDVDIKRNAQGHGNIYAFIRFTTLDMARRAKMDMSGQYIRKYQCRIGYGKPTPSLCVFVGGIGPWITRDELLREFDRFGEVRFLEWTHSKDFAFILYDSVECAKDAVKNMHGRDFGGIDRRLRVDFSDETCVLPPDNLPKPGAGRNGRTGLTNDYDIGGVLEKDRGGSDGYSRNTGCRGNWRTGRGSQKLSEQELLKFNSDRRAGGERSSGPAVKYRTIDASSGSERVFRTSSRTLDERNDSRIHPDGHKRHHSSSAVADRHHSDRDTPDGGNCRQRKGGNAASQNCASVPEEATSIASLASCLPAIWNGALMLKNSQFSTKMHLLSGDERLVKSLMGGSPAGKPVLKITQRLRLDQQKLGEVRRRINLSGPNGFCVLLAMPFGCADDEDTADGVVQQRPLKNLVAYLKQKDAAGVISLPQGSGQNHETGLLHAFPSCNFAQQYMTKYAPRLSVDSDREDHLLILLVRVHA